VYLSNIKTHNLGALFWIWVLHMVKVLLQSIDWQFRLRVQLQQVFEELISLLVDVVSSLFTHAKEIIVKDVRFLRCWGLDLPLLPSH